VPGTVETCTLGGFGFFAHRLQAGERLRLCVRALDDLVWQRNLHTLADPALADVAQARVARIKIHVGRGSGSRLELPTTSTVHAAALPTWTPQLP
jgi:predicted acyl esterase